MRSILAALLLSLPAVLGAALPGDSLQSILKEKGDPPNKMEFGNVKVLLYADFEIRLENDVVTTVTPRIAPPVNAPAAKQSKAKTPPKPQSKPQPKPKPKPKPPLQH